MVSLVAIALSDGVARLLCHRSAAGWGVKGVWRSARTSFVDAIDAVEVDLGWLARLFSGGFRWQRSRRWVS